MPEVVSLCRSGMNPLLFVAVEPLPRLREAGLFLCGPATELEWYLWPMSVSNEGFEVSRCRLRSRA